ncbi:isochorismate synthase [Nonomuraea sp. NPDC050394]|uniref:isochorismate synthase n=1 Tax=Nonomuraea sp. NPDC050394 TaxID=3364363 RepID=UPI0037B98012
MESLTTAADPLAGYERTRSVLFASPRGTLLTRGRSTIAGGELATLADRLPALLGQSGGLAAGAISFDGTAHLLVPSESAWSAPLPAAAPPVPSGRWWRRQTPAPAAYMRAVRLALAELEAGNLDKVVLARTLELRSDEPISLRHLLRPLLGHGYSFATPLPGGSTLAGASPELLVARHGRQVLSNPLAGSAERSADPVEDARRAAALLESAKDLHEHRLVVEAVTERLRRYCDDLDVPKAPQLTSTATMWHLSTKITGILRDPATSVLTLAAALHPTPAVCGTPQAAARRVIGELEAVERGFYSGLAGWCDAAGDGEWAVAIRCCEVHEHTVRLFAGAGIVAGSVPERELAETTSKFRTVLDALGAGNDALD